MGHDWSAGIAHQVSRAVYATTRSAGAVERLQEVLCAAVAICEGEGGVLEEAPNSDNHPALLVQVWPPGASGRIPPGCLEQVLRTGRSLGPPSLDGEGGAEDPSNGVGPVLAHPLRDSSGLRGVLAVRLNGGPAISPAVREAMDVVVCCATSILAAAASSHMSRRATGTHGAGRPIAGESRALLETLDIVSRVARSKAGILLLGESGAGKELIARRIHDESGRQGPFRAVNASAIPDTLYETEMFGCVKGGHSTATIDRAGHFEATDGGTLLLDEIGDLSLLSQAKTLRVLEEGSFSRVGETRDRKVDVRIVAATNRDLKKMVREGTFREDLYYRLAVVEIEVPPLRSRPEDIPPIVDLILRRAPSELELADRSPRSVTPAAMALLVAHYWAGNARQLKNVIHRLVLLCPSVIGEAEVARALASAAPRSAAAEVAALTMKQAQDELIRTRLHEKGGRRGETAQSLGITRQCLWKKSKRFANPRTEGLPGDPGPAEPGQDDRDLRARQRAMTSMSPPVDVAAPVELCQRRGPPAGFPSEIHILWRKNALPARPLRSPPA